MGSVVPRSARAFAVSGAVWLAGAVWLSGAAAADPATPSPVPSPGPPVDHAPGQTVHAAEAPSPVGVMDHDGLYSVGTDVAPGVYSSAGPVAGTKCYWKRIGNGGEILENALTGQPQVVQIQATDIAFKTRGCQPWQLTDGAAPPGQNPPWLSQFQFRHQLDVLNGLAGQSGNGQLPPY